jgi:S1-C subfamily serine protease
VPLKLIATLIAASVAILTACSSVSVRQSNLHTNSVMITNMDANHGGTGIILKSSQDSSLVLTNSHVCGVVEEGGLVKSEAGQFAVSSYKRSKKNDLCLIKVEGDLKGGAKIANKAPVPYYGRAAISGHPALYPNVVTNGHFSGRAILPIVTGIRKCTEEEKTDEKSGIYCALLGGIPVIKKFDSALVTATIMPGSSGSGVYNSDHELSGVVFAGEGNLSYAWTVPYASMRDFLFRESKTIPYSTPTNTTDLFGNGSEKVSQESLFRRLHVVCASAKRELIQDICEIAKTDITWYK